MVNTFLVCSDYRKSAAQLDRKRLGKQRVEAQQILTALQNMRLVAEYLDFGELPVHKSSEERRKWILALRRKYMISEPIFRDGKAIYPGWWSHPATRMWIGYEDALAKYICDHIDEWVHRGYKNNMIHPEYKMDHERPAWNDDSEFHENHQAVLFKKDPELYPKFSDIPAFDGYIWP